MTLNKRHIFIASKLLISFGLIIWLLAQADLRAVIPLLLRADPTLLILAVLAHAVAFALMNLRWCQLLRQLHPRFGWRDTAPSFCLGLFANNFLPAGVGGDVAKIWHLRRKGAATDSLIAATLLDRILGLTAIVLMAGLILLGLGGALLPNWIAWLLGISLLIILLSLILLFSPKLPALLDRHQGGWLISKLSQTVNQLQSYRANPGRLLAAVGLTLVLQLLVVTCYWLLGLAIGDETAASWYLLVVPMVLLLQNLPVSVGGLGVRETGFVALMASVGMDQTSAVGVSMLFLMVFVMLTMPGGLVLLFDRPRSLQDWDGTRLE